MPEDAEVLVVGAGIAGMAAAHRLKDAGRTVLVLESGPGPGGRNRTETWAGCQIELGAVYLTPKYAELMRLVDAVVDRTELEPIPNAFRTAIRRDGRWHYVDYAHTLNPVARAMDFARFRALRWRDKASMAKLMGPMLRVARRGRFFDVASAAAVDTAPVEDVVSPDTARYYLSPLIEIFCGYRPQDFGLPMVALAVDFPGEALTHRSGIGGLSTALAAGLDVRYGVRAARVEPDGSRVTTADGGTYSAEAVVVATPADAALELWPEAPEPTRSFLASAGYADTCMVFLRTREPFAPLDRRGRELYMEVVPADRDTALHALVFLNFAAPDGGLLLVAVTPDARRSLDDEALAARVESELEELHPELAGKVVDRRIVRVPKVVPRFPVGRARELRDFRSRVEPGPIQLAGDYLYGPCMESAAQAGRDAAERADRHLAGPT
jgi:oxygen-dependent protoporphyrinogen oxidase